MVGRGFRKSRDLRPGCPHRPLGGQIRLNHSTPRGAQHSNRSAVVLAAAGPAALPELAAITLGTSRVSSVTWRCQHLHKGTRAYVYWPIEPAEHLCKPQAFRHKVFVGNVDQHWSTVSSSDSGPRRVVSRTLTVFLSWASFPHTLDVIIYVTLCCRLLIIQFFPPPYMK